MRILRRGRTQEELIVCGNQVLVNGFLDDNLVGNSTTTAVESAILQGCRKSSVAELSVVAPRLRLL
ncbi:MAG: hypothetical protein E6J80_11625 [Deltaproteobacteria bacterium]|nr:MAG: hypothetical protein E6J80_11625 [Deltaproteobacteria bacterium]